MYLQRVSTISTQSVVVKDREAAYKQLVEWDRDYEDLVNLEQSLEGDVFKSIDAAKFNGQWYIVVSKMTYEK